MLWEQPRLLRSSARDLVPYYHSSGFDITTRHLVYYSHKIRYIIPWHSFFKSLYIFTYSQSGCKSYSSIIGGAAGHAYWELRDAPFGGWCVETSELEGRELTINTPPHLSQHPHRIHNNEHYWFEEHRNWVRRYDATWHWRSMHLRGSMKSWTERGRPKVGKYSVCIFIAW